MNTLTSKKKSERAKAKQNGVTWVTFTRETGAVISIWKDGSITVIGAKPYTLANIAWR